jgi:hypothetical protein
VIDGFELPFGTELLAMFDCLLSQESIFADCSGNPLGAGALG